MNPTALLLIAVGALSVLAGAGDWDWFMNHRKARFVCGICGRGGARVFYVLLGGGLIFLGALIAAGVVDGSGGRFGSRP